MDVMTRPKHPVYALTTSELDRLRSALEHAIGQISPGSQVPDDLRNELADVIAEQEQRARIRQTSRGSGNRDDYSVRQLSTAELERTKRELNANLGLLTPGSPAHVPIQSHMRAIDAELAERARDRRTSEARS
jgi:hypothetical protein